MVSDETQAPESSRPVAIDLSVLVQDPLWQELPHSAAQAGSPLDVEAVLRRAIFATLAALPVRLDPAAGGCELALVLTDDAGMRDLNHTWRGQDNPTDVLSFPGDNRFVPTGEPLPLGDIVLARETILRDAQEMGRALEHHLSHMAVHGMLHLLGWDHEIEAEAERMEAQEREILSALGYAEREADSQPDARERNTGR